jgi:2-dehydropantoate 2-reductase
MRILIYGAGAVGNYLGAHLAIAGHHVTLLGRKHLVDAIANQGMTLKSTDGSEQIVSNIQAVSSLDQVLAGGSFDLITFTMKAYDTLDAVQEMHQRIPSPPPIVCFQNGIGNEELLRDAFGADNVVAATMTTAVSMSDISTIIEERARGIALAKDAPAAAMIEEAFRQTSLHLEMIDSASSLKWSKLLTNMLANAACAILDMPPAETMKIPDIFRLEIMALQEALIMMQMQHIPVVNLPGTPVKLLALSVKSLPAWLLQPLLYRQVAGGRGDKLPSLQVTLRNGSKETEAPWLNGAVAKAASDLKRLTPINHMLALLVTDIASGKVAWETYRHKPEMLMKAVRIAEGMPR